MMHKQMCGKIGPASVQDKTISDYIERKQDSFDRYPYMKHSTAEPQETVKKLSFDEWWNEKVYDGNIRGYHWGQKIFKDELEIVWKAAQENV